MTLRNWAKGVKHKYMNNFLTKKVEKKTTEIERKGKKMLKKAKVYAVIIGILIAFGLVFYLFMKVSAFYDENRAVFQYPVLIKFQSSIKLD